MHITVSPTGFSDWPQLLGLVQDSFAYMDARIDPPSSLKKMGIEEFKTKAVQETLILAQEGLSILGCAFAAVREDCVYVGKVAVAQSARGKGVARALFAAAEAVAREHRREFLELQTRVELTENHAAFSALGFQKVSESAHPGYARPTSITMRKRVLDDGATIFPSSRAPQSGTSTGSSPSMLQVAKLISQGQGLATVLLKRASTVELDWDVRQKSRFDAGDSLGRALGIFLPRGTVVRGGDVLIGEDGSLIKVVAAPQPVLKITHCRAHGTPYDLIRAAYHLGNRHVPIELKPDHLKIEPDHVLADMLRAMHLIVTAVDEAFEPENGAYATGGHAHGEHSHGHGGHDHGVHHH